MFLIAIAASAAWGAALVTLAIATANPITLNPVQVRNAHFVATATVSVERPGTVVVAKEWKRGEELGTIVVENMQEARAVPGERYLMPLTRTAPDRYRVTDSPNQKLPPLIYPSKPEAERQLAEILDGRFFPD